jgi:hypothetical protein
VTSCWLFLNNYNDAWNNECKTKRTLSKMYYSVTGPPACGNLTTFKYQNIGGGTLQFGAY